MWVQRRNSMDAVLSRLVPSAPPVTLDHLVARVSTEVGMPVKVMHAVGRGTGVSGAVMTLTTERGATAVVFAPAEGTPEYQLFVVGHELWHLIEGHDCARAVLDGESASWWTRRCAERREAECDRFARRLGLAVTRRQNADRAPSPAEVMLGEAFGLNIW